jgi:predicted Zn finger-like uncharacterized protein
MIVSCPACATRYLLEPIALGPKGRQVRCAQCGHSWQQNPPADMPRQVELAAPKPLELGLPERRRAASRGGVGLGPPLFVLLLLVLGAGAGYFFRDQIILRWPQSAQIYELLGLPSEAAGAGLQLGNINFLRHEIDGHLVVEVQGDISNLTTQDMMIPRLVATLRDTNDQPLFNWTFDVKRPSIRAGQTISFKTQTRNPPPETSRITVNFVGGP